MPNVIVLQHAGCEGLGTIADALASAKIEFRTVHGDLGEAIPNNLDDAAGLIVMGGPMGVYEDHLYPFLAAERRLIEAAMRAEKPVLGVCLGSQLLASALGATVYKGPSKEIGWYPVYLESAATTDALFEDAPSQFQGFHWHGDVFDVPAGAVKLAHSDLTGCQAFRQGKAYGLLFHLEVTQATIHGMAAAFPEELAEAGGSVASLDAGIGAHLPALQSIGADVFRRWSAAVT
jgi:GMP synthase (glutamine-hydrolysing)